MKKSRFMYSFSSKLWYDKRWISKSGDVSIYLQVTLNGKHAEYPLKLRWPVDKIDLVNCELLSRRRNDHEVNDYNMLIRREQGKHSEILLTYRLKQAPIDLKQFSREVRIFDKRESFVSFMRRDAQTRYSLKEIDKRTWLNHNSALNRMILFDDRWLFENLTIKWMQRFRQTLVDANYEPGSVWSIIKNVKVYLQRARQEPLLTVDEKVASFPNPMPKWKTNFLNRDELNAMIKVYTTGNIEANQRNVLRAFLFTCFTSLRISDVYRVNGQWKMSEGFLDFIPKKNEKKKKWVHVPIMPGAYAFVKSSTGKYFDLPSEKEYNLILKVLAGIAGIKKNVTSHYGRHTYGYLHMTSNGNLKSLKVILGHSKIETTDRYAHLDDEYQTESVKKIQDEFPQLLELMRRS